jgi:formate hydrogenlyase subunit 3/multisubunit Na+/H+ antiporter MnhD subunit
MAKEVQTVVVIIGLLGFLGAVVAFIVVSVIMATRASTEAAAENRKENKPVSNGFAPAALVTLVVIFVLALALGIIPPLLQRG